MALLGTTGRNGQRPPKNFYNVSCVWYFFFFFFFFFYVILYRIRQFLYIEYRITKLVELTVVYPFFLLPACLMYLFTLPYHVNML